MTISGKKRSFPDMRSTCTSVYSSINRHVRKEGEVSDGMNELLANAARKVLG